LFIYKWPFSPFIATVRFQGLSSSSALCRINNAANGRVLRREMAALKSMTSVYSVI